VISTDGATGRSLAESSLASWWRMIRIRLVRVPAVEVVHNLLCILEPGGGELRGFVVPNLFNNIFEVWPSATAFLVPAGIYYLFYLPFFDAVYFNEKRRILILFR
jgi:hypothetical protein